LRRSVRGGAQLYLKDGTELRLSRTYRDCIETLLKTDMRRD
jgi:hypothetical protein